MKQHELTIDIVERETGLSKEVLRKWETRYGFPNPKRDGRGRRVFTRAEIDRLNLVKRLMLGGAKPAALLTMSRAALEQQAALLSANPCLPTDDSVQAILTTLREHPKKSLLPLLQTQLRDLGLSRFVLDFAVPLNYSIGQAWEQGTLNVFHEHLFTEAMARVLKEAITGMEIHPSAPSVLLASPPGESHTLGLLFLEALLSEQGARCYALGSGTPMKEVAAAAAALGTSIVGLSFSAAYPARNIASILKQLRQHLKDTSIAVWIGGAGIAKSQQSLTGVSAFTDLSLAVTRYQEMLAAEEHAKAVPTESVA